jgi:RNA polymerase sigma-70 factor (ECF subfamily)
VVSETFVAAIRTIDRFDPERGAFYSWLVGIAKNKRNDFLRKKKRDETASNRPPVEESTPPPEIDRLRQALLELDDEERLVLEWKYLEGQTVRDIAQRLGRTEKAIEALLYRARGRCREGDARMQSQE